MRYETATESGFKKALRRQDERDARELKKEKAKETTKEVEDARPIVENLNWSAKEVSNRKQLVKQKDKPFEDLRNKYLKIQETK
jgi:methylthioribose-1-phosphate isomerase